MHCQDFILLPFAMIWILITLNLLHMFLKCYIAVNHVLTTVYFMLQMCLDFYSSILVETPEYANPGNEIQLETTNESYVTYCTGRPTNISRPAQWQQWVFVHDCFIVCMTYNWFPRHQFGLLRKNNNNNYNKLFFINLALACLRSRCLKVVWAQESTRHTKKPAEVSSPLVKRFHHFLYLIIFLIVLILMCLSHSVIIVQIFFIVL